MDVQYGGVGCARRRGRGVQGGYYRRENVLAKLAVIAVKVTRYSQTNVSVTRSTAVMRGELSGNRKLCPNRLGPPNGHLPVQRDFSG